MKLEELLKGVAAERVLGAPRLDAAGLSCDSRAVRAGDLFVALSGARSDGHAFVREALDAGAAGVVVERPEIFESLRTGGGRKVAVLVRDSRKALARLSANFHGNPSHRLTVAGITGTNGKTTTSYLCESVLLAAGLRPGVVGTVNYRVGGQVWPSTHTTPGPLELDELLVRMAEAGARGAVMEVSSHALSQCRVDGIEFDAVIFTNLTQDHLDFHPTMNDYFLAKRRLFTEVLAEQRLKKTPALVINADDEWGRKLLAEARSAGRRALAYTLSKNGEGVSGPCEIYPTSLSWDAAGFRAGVRTPAGELQLKSPLVGEHNVYNALAAVGMGVGLGLLPAVIEQGIASCARVPGRLDPVPHSLGFTVLVDYAHSPDALRNVLPAARKLARGKVLCVFGCGGDRDRAKRPLMARAVSELADLAILTSDNPRTEDPAQILADTRAGLQGREGREYVIESDRRKAISLAIERAQAGDVVLIAGKGHEDYQIVGTQKHHFDDREEAARALRSREGAAAASARGRSGAGS